MLATNASGERIMINIKAIYLIMNMIVTAKKMKAVISRISEPRIPIVIMLVAVKLAFQMDLKLSRSLKALDNPELRMVPVDDKALGAMAE